VSAKEMFKKLGYACDESCDGILYSKWVEKDNIDYNIQIHIEKIPFTFMKTITKEVFNPSKPIEFTFEELQAINKQVEELGWNNETNKIDYKNYLKSYVNERKYKYTKLDKHDKAIEELLLENEKIKKMFNDETLNKYYHGMSYEFEIDEFKKDILKIIKGEENESKSN